MTSNTLSAENDSSLFNFGYGNLLKQIEETDNENSVSISPKNLENKIKDRAAAADNNRVRREHKYSPSYAVNDMSEIMKHLNIPMNDKREDYDESVLVLNGAEYPQNLSKFSKNQFSVPEFHQKEKLQIMTDSPAKLSMGESNFNFKK
jgi:hypothetical protein